MFLSMPITSVESAVADRNRNKRVAVISNSNKAVYRVDIALIIPVVQLTNTTFTFLWFDFAQWLSLATATNLNAVYNSFGRASEKGLNWADDPFAEEQKANAERRVLHQYLEGFFNWYILNSFQ